MEFGDLDGDKGIQDKLRNFHSSVEKIREVVELSQNSKIYEKLSIKEKIDYDLFMAYTLNTLYWLYLKTKGQDPSKNEVTNQFSRIKEYMIKAKEAHERHTIRPKINQESASRFVKHGIHYKKGKSTRSDGPSCKKIKFED